MFATVVMDKEGLSITVTVDRDPDGCPVCHYGIMPQPWHGGVIREQAIERLFLCPRRACEHLFIARYHRNPQSGCYFLDDLLPRELSNKTYSVTVRGVSADFCEIDNQAQKAERMGFLLVAGPGYRKALEFLIKDYLCAAYPEHKEEIEKTLLAGCIIKFVKNENIRLTASRAAWLGNDETHYVRKWEGKDLEDLKKLITLTVHWIEMEELTKDVAIDMPTGKK